MQRVKKVILCSVNYTEVKWSSFRANNQSVCLWLIPFSKCEHFSITVHPLCPRLTHNTNVSLCMELVLKSSPWHKLFQEFSQKGFEWKIIQIVQVQFTQPKIGYNLKEASLYNIDITTSVSVPSLSLYICLWPLNCTAAPSVLVLSFIRSESLHTKLFKFNDAQRLHNSLVFLQVFPGFYHK